MVLVLFSHSCVLSHNVIASFSHGLTHLYYDVIAYFSYSPTHFNHDHKGKNYLRGYSFVETKGNVPWDGNKIKKYISDIGTPERHIGFVGINKDGWDHFPGLIHTGASHNKKRSQIRGLWGGWEWHS